MWPYGEAAAKDPMPNTLSPSYAYTVRNDVLNNRNAGSIQTKVLINEEESSPKRVLDKFNTDSGKTNKAFYARVTIAKSPRVIQ